MREPQVTFPMRELDRLKVIQAVIDGDLKPIRAAERRELYEPEGPTVGVQN